MNENQILPFTLNQKVHQLKERLLKQVLEQSDHRTLQTQIQIVANDALMTASLHPEPFLVFPILFQEKVESVIEAQKRKEEERLSLAA